MSQVPTPKLVLVSLLVAIGFTFNFLYRQDQKDLQRTLSARDQERSLQEGDEMFNGASAAFHLADIRNENDLPESLRDSTYAEDIPWEDQIPKLIVGGAQKGGTTALYNILRRDQQFISHAPRCRASPELHFFDWYIRKENTTLNGLTPAQWQGFLKDERGGLTRQVVHALRAAYRYCWNFEIKHKDPKKAIAFEKTPIYMIVPHLPVLIKRVAPWTKMLFMIRDPVARAYSSWKMHNARDEAALTFEEHLNQEISLMREMGISNAPTLDEFSAPGFNLKDSQRSFQPPLDIFGRRFKRSNYVHDKQQVYLYRGMYAELLEAWMEHFEIGKNLMVISYERFLQDRLEMVHRVQEYAGAKATDVSAKVLEENYHGGYTAAKLDTTTQRYLELFFEPYNQELVELLGQDWYDYHVGDQWSTSSSSSTSSSAALQASQ